jgi:hypothetical protein
MKRREIGFHQHFEEIFESEKLTVEKLAEGFGFVVSRILAESYREIEILRAMGDKGGLVKEQIKHSTVQHVMEAFGECYFRATGERWEMDGRDE